MFSNLLQICKETASYITKSQESEVYNTQASHRGPFEAQISQGQAGTYGWQDSVQAGNYRTSIPYKVKAACI